MEAYFMTDIGKVRGHNEDSGGIFYNQSKQILAIVADGMGGHAGGDIASQLATNAIQKKWEKENEFASPKELEEWITDTLLEANYLIYKEAKEKEELDGMGTTVVLAVCTEEFVTIAHIGDSRCYLYSNGSLKQLTEDHTLVNELLRTGQISADDAAYHPRRNVLSRALGTEKLAGCEVQTITWDEGSKLLLCSDGLTNKVDEDELANILGATEHTSHETGEELINLANNRGGEDNISLAIIHHESTARVGGNE